MPYPLLTATLFVLCADEFFSVCLSCWSICCVQCYIPRMTEIVSFLSFVLDLFFERDFLQVHPCRCQWQHFSFCHGWVVSIASVQHIVITQASTGGLLGGPHVSSTGNDAAVNWVGHGWVSCEGADVRRESGFNTRWGGVFVKSCCLIPKCLHEHNWREGLFCAG